MTGHILALIGANLVMLLLGSGLLALSGLARSRAELVSRALLGYLVGIAATGILASELAILGVAVGPVLLIVAALVMLAAGLLKLGASTKPPEGARAPAGAPAFVLLGLAFLLLARAIPLFATKPLLESDGWMIWGLRARALFEFGHPTAPVFTSLTYPALQHPLWLPALEAVDFRFMRSFDGTTIHLQLLGLAVAFVGGTWTLLRSQVTPLLLAAILLAIVAAPSFLGQLQTNFADIPLAMLVGLGIALLAAWLRTGERSLLAASTLFLASAAITKNEGEVFALAAYISAAAVAERVRYKALGWSALAVVAVDAPWRIWLWSHHVKIAEYSLSNLFSPSYLSKASGRVEPSARELISQLFHVSSWSYLTALVVVGLAGGAAVRQGRLTAFTAGWLSLSFGGLVLIYWISINPLSDHLHFSSNRTIDSLVLGGALLLPLLLGAQPADLPESQEAVPVTD